MAIEGFHGGIHDPAIHRFAVPEHQDADRSRPLRCSIGMTVTDGMQEAILKVPARSWTPAYDGVGDLAERWPWTGEITTAVTRLQPLPSG